MRRVVDPLNRMGASIAAVDGEYAPLTLGSRPQGGRLRAIDYRLPVASAQVKTALLLAALRADGTCSFWEPAQSRDHTERLLQAAGVRVERLTADDGSSTVGIALTPPEFSLSPIDLTVPGDFSSASFLIVAGLVTPGSEITLRLVGLNPTRTGLLDVLERMGAEVQISGRRTVGEEVCGDVTVRTSHMDGTGISDGEVVGMIDEFPIFAVAAAYAAGISDVRGAVELRTKESDRITSLSREMRSLGVEIEEATDGFRISGDSPPAGGEVDPQGDHRLAMALTVAGLAARTPTVIRGAEIVSESYPGFFKDLRALGAEMEIR
jgi:3-phosphoshikimate 1-carboxyvinyltransferase